jgi:hypothetical protein
VKQNSLRKPNISRKTDRTIIPGPISSILKAKERLTEDGFQSLKKDENMNIYPVE